jgi:hypothetical protein
MTLSTLINKRREVHEAHDNGPEAHGQERASTNQPQHAVGRGYADVARHGQADHDQAKLDEQHMAEYRANNLGAGQATMAEVDAWRAERALEQPAPELTQEQQNQQAREEQDWNADLAQDNNRERTNANNREPMRAVPRPNELPDINDDQVLEAARPAPNQDLAVESSRKLRR